MQPGYYWIKVQWPGTNKPEWVVAERTNDSHWELAGSDQGIRDNSPASAYIIQIGPRIPEPE